MPLVFAEGDRWVFAASTIGDGPMNPTDYVVDQEALLQRMHEVFDPLLPSAASFHVAQLCHGDTIAMVEDGLVSKAYDKTDGLVTEMSGAVLRVTGADCPPVFLVDESVGRIALVHSGRKGARRNIAGKVVREMVDIGSEPSHIMAIIGPGVCPRHYSMPPEILSDFVEYPEAINGTELNLRRVIRSQLLKAGLRDDMIRDIDECTFEMPEKWFSYRRDTQDGLTFDRPRVQAFVAMLK
ncbi:MAG: polyphenol oxidase family protein [Patescibacteria group bacterium]